MNNNSDPAKLKLNGAKVVFYTGPEDEKAKEFGTSITIALDPESKKIVEDFYKTNNVGKNGDPNKGKANIKEYTNEETGVTTEQLSIKFNEHTQFAGLKGLGQDDLGYGATINLIAKAYEYKKFGGGIAVSASAIVVTKGAASNNDADLAELMEDLGDTADVEDTSVPF